MLKELLRDEAVRSISRRYFISNGFDGTLTSIGIIVGAVLSGIPDGTTVLKIGIGGAIGLSTSGVWSVWEIERAEKRAELQSIEHAMLTDLKDTQLQRRRTGARVINAFMSGLGPLIGILIPLFPFALEGIYLTMFQAAIGGVALGSGVLFVFGAYLGSISNQRWYVAGFRMGIAGGIVALLNIVLPG